MGKASNSTMVRTYVLTIIAISLWGMSFVWSNAILKHGVPPFTLLFTRLAIAGILLWIWAKVSGNLQKVDRKDYKYMFLMAFFEPFIYFIGETYGMQITGSAVIAAVIIATIPICCMLVEKIFYHMPFKATKIAGAAITLPGILLVVMKGNDFSVDNTNGILLLFMAVGAATGYGAMVKNLSGKYNPTTIATYQFLIGSLLFLPLFLAFGLDGLNGNFFNAGVLLPLAALAVLCSCVAFIFWVTSIKNLGIAKANIFSALIPAVSAIGAALLGQEKVTAITFAGIAIVIAGVILAQKE